MTAELGRLVGLAEGDADVAGEGVVARHTFIRALDDDDVLLAAKRLNDRGFGEGADDVDVDGADLGIALLAQPVAGFLDVLCRTSERDEDRVCVLAFVFRDETVAAAGELTEFPVGVGEEPEDGLVEVVPAGDHTIHVVLLILNRAEQNRMLQVHHLRQAAAGRTEELLLCRCGAVDSVVGRAEEVAQQLRLGGEVGPFRVGGEHAILHVHARVQGQFADLPKDDGLIGCLLGVFGKKDAPAGVERGIDVIVTAVDVEGMFGQRPGTDLQHHGRAFARRVVVLLHRIDDALAGGEIHRALAGDRQSSGAALGRVLALRLDGDLAVAPDVQFALGIGGLIKLAALGGGGDWVEHAALGDACLDVLGDELVAVAGHPDTGKGNVRFLLGRHDISRWDGCFHNDLG